MTRCALPNAAPEIPLGESHLADQLEELARAIRDGRVETRAWSTALASDWKGDLTGDRELRVTYRDAAMEPAAATFEIRYRDPHDDATAGLAAALDRLDECIETEQDEAGVFEPNRR